ncbi:MAG: hypothetical protein WC916_00970 [Candidatus Woesearchaeota archaeon]
MSDETKATESWNKQLFKWVKDEGITNNELRRRINNQKVNGEPVTIPHSTLGDYVNGKASKIRTPEYAVALYMVTKIEYFDKCAKELQGQTSSKTPSKTPSQKETLKPNNKLGISLDETITATLSKEGKALIHSLSDKVYETLQATQKIVNLYIAAEKDPEQQRALIDYMRKTLNKEDIGYLTSCLPAAFDLKEFKTVMFMLRYDPSRDRKKK